MLNKGKEAMHSLYNSLSKSNDPKLDNIKEVLLRSYSKSNDDKEDPALMRRVARLVYKN
ncbi:hypothetical protein FC72_GL000844 [Companilactobacillus tucceti DSM 20183]|uniref:Uncharacterized protein n=1 Tax=Companilactobacillus tucceti DSM 20183 TaxID=1423811 RepID=A0A0R1J9X1_9LACO|nr:hypothetical protein [Companilactobacillus tucceti]KRK63959.1 hypothetical protein FC72_GL000844 [Companilactobacillus tucceti DSM 20183]